MTKIMILNGPPRCGKDTAALAIEEYFGEDTCKHIKLSKPLKWIASKVIGLPIADLEEVKDAPMGPMQMTFRDAQIHIFNQLAPIFGDDWLSAWTLNEMMHYDQTFFVVSDGGRTADILPFLKIFPPEDLLIVQIMREGCTFANDIRSYITANNVRTRPTVNKDIEAFKAEMIDFAGEFFGNE